MCPFCVATAVWIAAGAVSTGGLSALAVAKFRNRKPVENQDNRNQDGGWNDQQ